MSRPKHIRALLKSKEYLRARNFALGLLHDGLIDAEECGHLCSMFALNHLDGFGASGKNNVAVVVLTTTGGANWTVSTAPQFNKLNNTIEGIGTGAKGSVGQSGTTSTNGGGGADGGGGAYAKLVNFDPGVATTIPYAISAGTVTNPGDTTFNTSSLVAKSGNTVIAGQGASCTPSTGAQNGGKTGGTGVAGSSGNGGGGAAGSTGAGQAGGASTTTIGAAPAAGAAGTGSLGMDSATNPGAGGLGGLWNGAGSAGSAGGAASNYGGSGGGGGGGGKKVAVCDPPGFAGGAGGNGAQGVIVISWIYFA